MGGRSKKVKGKSKEFSSPFCSLSSLLNSSTNGQMYRHEIQTLPPARFTTPFPVLYRKGFIQYNSIVKHAEDLIRRLISLALEEDRVEDDVTTNALRSLDRECSAFVTAREDGVISGLQMAAMVFRAVDEEMQVTERAQEGATVRRGDRVMAVRGMEGSILKGERTALNFLQRLSGIATLTAAFVERVRDTGVRILDTRKTTPGMRYLEKEAVCHGGGFNHRLHLQEMAMIKDNHVRMAGSIRRAVELVRTHSPGREIVVEVRDLSELTEALECGARWVLLDNFTDSQVRRAIEVKPPGVRYEVSGNVGLENLTEKALPGIDCISVGALTHSFRSMDFSLNVERE